MAACLHSSRLLRGCSHAVLEESCSACSCTAEGQSCRAWPASIVAIWRSPVLGEARRCRGRHHAGKASQRVRQRLTIHAEDMSCTPAELCCSLADSQGRVQPRRQPPRASLVHAVLCRALPRPVFERCIFKVPLQHCLSCKTQNEYLKTCFQRNFTSICGFIHKYQPADCRGRLRVCGCLGQGLLATTCRGFVSTHAIPAQPCPACVTFATGPCQVFRL